ncbi:MAG: metallophosphoesterase [Phycisphaerales bacterium]|nr:MAG: metallophosphoesterase [Phycisphaerales bacterium]
MNMAVNIKGRKMRRTIFALLAAVCGLCGCGGSRVADEAKLPIRIGVLADSQITSLDYTPTCQYKNKELDKQIETAIRPPALAYLAAGTLETALQRLVEPNAGVDVVLYLGDGANNGGAGEVNDLFTILEEFREEYHVPVFVVIGNHDYLGAGNTEDFVERVLLLNRSRPGKDAPFGDPYERPLSKCEVLQKIRGFNQGSAGAHGAGSFKYSDLPQQLDCGLNHKSGLYLAGRVAYSDDGGEVVEILLADTSDYQDSEFEPEFAKSNLVLRTWDFYGSKGSISFVGKKNPPQGDCLRELGENSSAPFRFMASHYPPDHLDRILPELSLVHGAIELVGGVLGSTFAAQHLDKLHKQGSANFWLSGHTHRSSMDGQPQMTFGDIFAQRSFGSINVGSTTDFRAHVAIIEAYEKGRNKRVRDKDKVGYRQIPIYSGSPSVPAVLEAVGEWGGNHRGDTRFWNQRLASMDDRRFGASILGLNREYQEDYWTGEHSEASVAHLRAFIGWLVRGRLDPQAKRPDIMACLAFIAGAYEDKLDPTKEYRSVYR